MRGPVSLVFGASGGKDAMSRINYQRLAEKFVKDEYGYPSRLKYHRATWWVWDRNRLAPDYNFSTSSKMSRPGMGNGSLR